MKKVTIILTLLLATVANAQLFTPHFGGGFFGGNQDNDNPINLTELKTWDNYTEGVTLGEWMTQDQLNEFKRRTDGRLFGTHYSVGTYLNLLEYRLQGVESKAGLNLTANFYHQSTNSNYDVFAFSPSIGAFFETGFRTELGIQKFNTKYNWYLDLSAPIISKQIKIYTRYQRDNPFTNEINSQWIMDGSSFTLETFSAGIRIAIN